MRWLLRMLAAPHRPETPNTALAGFTPAPDIVTPACAAPPERLFAAFRHLASN